MIIERLNEKKQELIADSYKDVNDVDKAEVANSIGYIFWEGVHAAATMMLENLDRAEHPADFMANVANECEAIHNHFNLIITDQVKP